MVDEPFATSDFSIIGRKTFDRMVALQQNFLGALQDINQQWVATINAEIALASETLTKLAAAKSIPDTVAACQNCGTRQMEIVAENSRGLQAANEKIMSRLSGNGVRG